MAKCNVIICNDFTCLSAVAIEQKQYTWEENDLKSGKSTTAELKYLKWEAKKQNVIFTWNFFPASRVELISGKFLNY